MSRYGGRTASCGVSLWVMAVNSQTNQMTIAFTARLRMKWNKITLSRVSQLSTQGEVTSQSLWSPVFEKTCATTQKNVKSLVFLKSEKNVKNVKKRRPTAYVQFHRLLNHSAFNTQLPKPKLSTCTGKSPTSHTLPRNVDTRN